MRSKVLFAILFLFVSVRCMDGQPNYTGWVDLKGCNGIVGWAADLARPDAAILVSMWEGATMISSTVARSPRADVGAVIKDNGLHGFSLDVPADGVKHVFQLHFDSGAQLVPSNRLGSPIVLQCGTPTIPPIVPVVAVAPLPVADTLALDPALIPLGTPSTNYQLSKTPSPNTFLMVVYRSSLYPGDIVNFIPNASRNLTVVMPPMRSAVAGDSVSFYYFSNDK